MIRELRDFLFKGNVLDLAVAVVMGAAFNAIVTSLVSDIISHHLSLTQLLRLLTLKTSLNCHGTVSHTVAS